MLAKTQDLFLFSFVKISEVSRYQVHPRFIPTQIMKFLCIASIFIHSVAPSDRNGTFRSKKWRKCFKSIHGHRHRYRHNCLFYYFSPNLVLGSIQSCLQGNVKYYQITKFTSINKYRKKGVPELHICFKMY